MPKKTDVRAAIAGLDKEIAERIKRRKDTVLRLQSHLGKIVIDAGAGSFPDASLAEILALCVKHGEAETLARLQSEPAEKEKPLTLQTVEKTEVV